MSQVYSVGEDSSTKQLERIACTNEDKELQRLLENNLDLLPGEQINPEEKLRWLIIKREMPVTNPSSGEIWWSIDFFLVDQFGIPTLVECKRRNDTRSRREVVGQMLEYAANGRHYWSASDMRSYAQNAAGDEAKLAAKLRDLTGAETDAEVFFASVEQNLHTSKMRLVFFLEDSPLELRSVVEFLNGQLKETEVLIVEARQYRFENTRIVVPSLFGFTEEARVAKRESRAEIKRAASVKGEAAFWTSIEEAIGNNDWVGRIHDFVAKSFKTPGCKVVWITSCIFLFPACLKRGLFGIKRNGYLELYFGYWHPQKYQDIEDRQVAVRVEFQRGIESIFNLKFSESQSVGFPQIPPEKWVPLVDELQNLVQRIAPLADAENSDDRQSLGVL